MARRSGSDNVLSARARLGLPERQPVVLLSFGGFGFEVAPAVFESLPEALFVMTERPSIMPGNVRVLDRNRLAYEDLLRAADAVVTKPGYGITAEALANGTRVLYTQRGRFPEFPILARALEEHGTAAFVSLDDLRLGRIGEDLRALLARPVRQATLSTDGGRVVARRLLEEIE